MYICLLIKYPLFLPDFKEIFVFSTDFLKIINNIKYHAKNPSSGSRVAPWARMDSFRNFGNTPKKYILQWCFTFLNTLCFVTNIHVIIVIFFLKQIYSCVLCVCVCVCIYIYTYTHTCVHIYIYMYVSVYTYIHIYIHTHTHTVYYPMQKKENS